MPRGYDCTVSVPAPADLPSVFWGPVPDSPPSPLAHHHEVLVVGAGITGLTTAVLLARRGVDVAVVDARRPGGGTTAKSTAKATLLHGTVGASIRAQHGPQAVAEYVAANRSGQDLIRQMCDDSGAVDVQIRDTWTYATSGKAAAAVAREHAAAREAGLPVGLAEPAELPFPTTAAVRLTGQLQINPVQYLAALLGELSALGVPVAWPHRVGRISADGDQLRATGAGGLSTTARWVVLATLLPFPLRTLMFATTTAQRSYSLACRVDGPLPQGMYLDAGSPSRSLRTALSATGEELLLVGGNGHPVGKRLPTSAHVEDLADWSREHFAVTDFTHRWSAQDYVSSDVLPQVGPSPLGPQGLLMAAGFGKWGITNGTAAAQILTGQILGEKPEWARVYAPRVTTGVSGWRRLAVSNAAVAADLAKGWLLEPGLSPAGTGVRRGIPTPRAVSTVAGQRRTCSAVCTHLGGIVRWNDAESSWDCPLHGSRFAPDGEVLTGPAVEALPCDGDGVSSAPQPDG